MIYLALPPILKKSNNYKSITNAQQGAGNSGVTSFSSWVSTLTQDASGAASPAASGATGALAYTVTVNPTVTRLGNINLYGSKVTTSGSGSLVAPTDASINIVNNTANTLALNNLSVPSYDAGHIRVNGVLVNSAADITNVTGIASNFGANSIVTAANSGTSKITITSNYNPNDATYNSPTNTIPALRTGHVAPDIILNSLQAITNVNGSVSILSAAGNIYIQGAINAGSVSVVARNGDLVTSYVDGFNHVGGDPASITPFGAQLPLGAGLYANGDIYLAARYLNLNSTVQSGFANQSLTVSSATQLMTTDASLVGLTQSDVNAKVNAYKNAANKTGLATTFTYTNDVTLDLTTGQLIFSVETAGKRNFAGNFDFVPTSATSVTASYDTLNHQIDVAGTSVRGGHIQLYGQILNTSASAGQLNVLDGFGTINISNSTAIPVVLSTLNTGLDPNGNGRGTAGVIDILDVHLDSVVNPLSSTPNQVDATHTVYTRNYNPLNPSSAAMSVTQDNGIIDPNTGLFVKQGTQSTSAYTVTDSRNGTYNPLAGERYVFTTGNKYEAVANYSITERSCSAAVGSHRGEKHGSEANQSDALSSSLCKTATM